MNTTSLVARHFDARAAGYGDRYGNDGSPANLFQHEKQQRLLLTQTWLRDAVEASAEGTIQLLDVGCGDGKLLRTAAQEHSQLRGLGCDISARMVCAARSKCHQAVAQRLRFSRDLPGPGRQFDIVSSLGVIGYQVDQIAFLRQLTGFLRPHGYLVITFGNAQSIWRRSKQYLRRWRPGKSPIYQSLALSLVDQQMARHGLRRYQLRGLMFGWGCKHSRWEVAFSKSCEEHQSAVRPARSAQTYWCVYGPANTPHNSLED